MPFEAHGYYEFKLGIKGAFSSVVFSSPGKFTLTLPNGAKFAVGSKQVEVTGLLSKEKNFNLIETMKIVDIESNISSTVQFDSQKNARTGYWTSWVKGSDKVNTDTGILDNRRDLLKIDICKEVEDAKINLSEGTGSWLENITFKEKADAKQVWSINDDHLATKWKAPEDKVFVLLSDLSLIHI